MDMIIHKVGTTQNARDILKDRIMALYDIALLRCKTNGSGEKEKIVGRLDSLID